MLIFGYLVKTIPADCRFAAILPVIIIIIMYAACVDLKAAVDSLRADQLFAGVRWFVSENC